MYSTHWIHCPNGCTCWGCISLKPETPSWSHTWVEGAQAFELSSAAFSGTSAGSRTRGGAATTITCMLMVDTSITNSSFTTASQGWPQLQHLERQCLLQVTLMLTHAPVPSGEAAEPLLMTTDHKVHSPLGAVNHGAVSVRVTCFPCSIDLPSASAGMVEWAPGSAQTYGHAQPSL